MPAQTVIKVRRDTAANWISADPTLASGEIGFETDTNQLKIGNGTDEWTVLPYASGAGGASVEISETAPAEPEEGDVWFNSTDGRAYIYYDSTWVDLNPGIAGPPGATGETGIVIQTSEPSSTDVLWLDTDEEPDVPVPAGGTDGQVLTKTSSADYATAWEDIPEGTAVVYSATAPVDTNAIWYNTENGNAYVYYDSSWASISGLSIPAGGTTGQVLAKSNSGDYATEWVNPPSGNAIINGAFEINQRKLTSTPGITFFSASFGTDRWINYLDYHSNFSYQSLNESTVPTINSLRLGSVSMDNPYPYRLSVGQKIEDLNTYNLRGKTVTLSFYIKFNSSTFTSSFGPTPFNNFRYEIGYNTSTTNSAFRVSGHPDIPTSIADSYNFSTITNGFLPTTWTRITLTGTVPSTANNIHVGFGFEGAGYTITNNELNYEITGVQLEAGNVATPFRRNAPSIQAELAACQRYYFRHETSNQIIGNGLSSNTTASLIVIPCPVVLRVPATSIDFSTLLVSNGTTYTNPVTTCTINSTSTLAIRVAAAATGQTTNQPTQLLTGTNGFLGFSAEL